MLAIVGGFFIRYALPKQKIYQKTKILPATQRLILLGRIELNNDLAILKDFNLVGRGGKLQLVERGNPTPRPEKPKQTSQEQIMAWSKVHMDGILRQTKQTGQTRKIQMSLNRLLPKVWSDDTNRDINIVFINDAIKDLLSKVPPCNCLDLDYFGIAKSGALRLSDSERDSLSTLFLQTIMQFIQSGQSLVKEIKLNIKDMNIDEQCTKIILEAIQASGFLGHLQLVVDEEKIHPEDNNTLREAIDKHNQEVEEFKNLESPLFWSSVGNMQENSSFGSIPPEILNNIASHLSNSDLWKANVDKRFDYYYTIAQQHAKQHSFSVEQTVAKLLIYLLDGAPGGYGDAIKIITNDKKNPAPGKVICSMLKNAEVEFMPTDKDIIPATTEMKEQMMKTISKKFKEYLTQYRQDKLSLKFEDHEIELIKINGVQELIEYAINVLSGHYATESWEYPLKELFAKVKNNPEQLLEEKPRESRYLA